LKTRAPGFYPEHSPTEETPFSGASVEKNISQGEIMSNHGALCICAFFVECRKSEISHASAMEAMG
jgi:hypothetical protein